MGPTRPQNQLRSSHGHWLYTKLLISGVPDPQRRRFGSFTRLFSVGLGVGHSVAGGVAGGIEQQQQHARIAEEGVHLVLRGRDGGRPGAVRTQTLLHGLRPAFSARPSAARRHIAAIGRRFRTVSRLPSTRYSGHSYLFLKSAPIFPSNHHTDVKTKHLLR